MKSDSVLATWKRGLVLTIRPNTVWLVCTNLHLKRDATILRVSLLWIDYNTPGNNMTDSPIGLSPVEQVLESWKTSSQTKYANGFYLCLKTLICEVRVLTPAGLNNGSLHHETLSSHNLKFDVIHNILSYIHRRNHPILNTDDQYSLRKILHLTKTINVTSELEIFYLCLQLHELYNWNRNSRQNLLRSSLTFKHFTLMINLEMWTKTHSD